MNKILHKFSLKKLSQMGLGSAIILIVLCELPWILALLGFSILGSHFEVFSNNLVIEILTIVLITATLSLWIYRRFFRNRQMVQHPKDS